MHRWMLAILTVWAAAGCAPATVASPSPAPATPLPAARLGATLAPERPIPYPVVPPPEFLAAVERGSRTLTGAPGPYYWTNWADYRIRARLLPEAKRLEGSVQIRYHNRSPDTLYVLVLDLAQNLHAPGAVRSEPAEVTGGVSLSNVRVRGQGVSQGGGAGPRYLVQGTKLVLVPDAPVPPGTEVDLAMDWNFTIPQAGAGGRMGYSDDNLFFLAYWYPQMAAYDDVVGWHPDDFLGTTEFYNDHANYHVTLEAPAGWVVVGTGAHQNPRETLSPAVSRRLALAAESDTVVNVLTPADFSSATRTPPDDGSLTWTFRADSVRDVAYSLTRESIWDAVRTPVGDRDGDGQTEYALVNALYREPATRWRGAARYGQHAVRFLSEFTRYPYPWPHMTAVEGADIIGGGMEYPMMTLIGAYTTAGDAALYDVIAHEIAHMWVPLIVNTDERRYSWMDEGTTNFNENMAASDFFPGPDQHMTDRTQYLRVAAAGLEGELMRRSAYHYPGPAYAIASYMKPATNLVTLRGLLGEETFNRAYREYIRRWAFKHPYPWDMWNAFEEVSGRDLDWFWRTWYYETWTLDHALRSVTQPADGSATITVADLGDAPMPARLTVTRENGETLQREVPVETWLAGARTATVTVPAGSPVVKVEIDSANVFPDVDRANNVWTR